MKDVLALLSLFGGIIILFTPFYFWDKWIRKKKQREQILRNKALRQVAKKLGLPFQDSSERLSNICERLSIFKDGSPLVFNVLSFSVSGTKVDVFDLTRFVSYSGTNHGRPLQTVYRLCFPANSGKLPEFMLEPKQFSHLVSHLFNGQIIELSDFSEIFSDYQLLGSDQKAIQALFSGELLRGLRKVRSGLCVESYNNAIYIFRPFEYMDPDVQSVRKYFNRYHSIGMAFKKALETDSLTSSLN